MGALDWFLVARQPGGSAILVKPIIAGTFDFDATRVATRQLTGFSWTPTELAKIDLSSDDLLVYVSVDGAPSTQVATMRASSSAQQKDVLTNPDGTSGDLSHIDFADVFVRLNASSEVPFTVAVGTPPDVAMGVIADKAGLDHAFAGSIGPMASTVTWAPFTTFSTILNDLALQAGQRAPWANRIGVARSALATVVGTEVIALADLKPVTGTIVVTDNYLTAPDRVVVSDQSASSALVGTWDAPAVSPASAARRGYSIAVGVSIQGMASASQAAAAARVYGERQLARSLAATIAPESVLLLDGPNIISYLDANWLVQSWSLSTAPGSTMTLAATEVIDQ